jgi:RNA polymerase sigma factor (sigma-70 family)
MPKNTAHPKDFSQLMAELAEGSEEAAWQIANDYTPHVLRAIRAALPGSIRSKLDSQDLAQMIWASLLLKRSDLDDLHSPQQLINLLVRIAHNKVVDAYRHYTNYQSRDHRRESSIDAVSNSNQAASPHCFDGGLLDRELSPSQTAGLREKWQLVFESLSSRDRKILRHRMNGKTYAEIARAVGIGITTVRTTLEQIVVRLRDE